MRPRLTVAGLLIGWAAAALAGSGSTAGDTLRRVMNQLSENRQFDVQIVVSLQPARSSMPVSDTTQSQPVLQARLLRLNDAYRYELAGMDMFLQGGTAISVQPRSEILLINHADAVARNQLLPDDVLVQVKQWLSSANTVDITDLPNGRQGVTLTWQDGPVLASTLEYDVHSFQLQRLSYDVPDPHGGQLQRVNVEYYWSSLQHPETLDLAFYIRQSGDQWQAAPHYKGYQIVDLRRELSD